ncbi:hypothetical protein GLOTRDRAFT_114826 [Gloeophyllum trabeum ATCC 11539]|uniref:Uncharacterized protein n=1 Tax=Gloeophyllum trabeum (strain ATCC 11539 / FP-39264 / Madison 617) TaxID=670483 RepID=S7QGP7_GLOTA|nr:uncharacterized protein GLOTRDRAFT_114826 [Gloeophyllum trabeum ATCC 11539]EPQ58388.1 hypothetical protein GLOTRDRAFT_114826 [Gloeophyllum trabeum ATCC 11539]
MNFNGQDNLVLVAPRPVRLSSGTHFALDRYNRLVSAPAEQNDGVSAGDARQQTPFEESKLDVFLNSAASLGRDSASPRAPSRCSLPSEALEEFLSILRPSSLFTPSSPLFRPLHGRTMSISSLHSPQMRALHDRNNSPSPVAYMEVDRVINGRRTPHKLLKDKENTDGAHEALQPGAFHSSLLSSPVSRFHTRNPFQRHPSYEVMSGLVPPASSAMSPALVPLPSPTPTELDL